MQTLRLLVAQAGVRRTAKSVSERSKPFVPKQMVQDPDSVFQSSCRNLVVLWDTLQKHCQEHDLANKLVSKASEEQLEVRVAL